MKKLIITFFVVLTTGTLNLKAQQKMHNLPVKYEELTATHFPAAVDSAAGVVLIPFGIMEKHGPHMPLGTDLFEAREVALRGAAKEYAVVFPAYYFGQINEARHQPGTIAYSHEVIWNLLQETLDELSRNGFKKIIIVNGHGGNNDFLHFFSMDQLHSPKDYTLVIFQPGPDPEADKKIDKLIDRSQDMHAGIGETSMMMDIRPDIVHEELAGSQSGADQDRLSDIPHQYTGIWWYAKFPNHYGGTGVGAKPEAGELMFESEANQLAALIRDMKTKDDIKKLQDEFYKRSKNPLGDQ